MADVAKDFEDVMTDDVVTVKVNKDAIGKDTDVEVNVKISNKDPLITNRA